MAIVRPSSWTKTALTSGARAFMQGRFPPGEYSGKGGSEVINELFGFYDRILRETIPAIASRDAAELLLFQYDECQKILHGIGISDLEERRAWKQIEGALRRAIKYMVELICCEEPLEDAAVPKELAVEAFETALFAAESAANLAEMSERTHSIFPDQFNVFLDYSRSGQFIFIRIEGPNEGFDERMYERLRVDRQSRDEFLEQPQYDLNVVEHCRVLNDAFKAEFGATYGEFVHILRQVIDGSRPVEKGFPTLFVHRETTISRVADVSGLPRSAIETALDGFSVMPSTLKEEGRNLWNPKQPGRALRRGFFLFPHSEGTHIAFSRSMAMENMIHMMNAVSYQKIPEEWTTEKTQTAVKTLANQAGNWFEHQVAENLRKLGYQGSGASDRIRHRGSMVQIPSDVGQLDFLGIHEQDSILLLVECKMSLTGLEARFWRDDLDRFVWRKRSYRDQLVRKANWLKGNRLELAKLFGLPDIFQIATVMVTLYPCIADEVIDEFRCVSLSELILAHRRRSGWPYGFVEQSI